MAIEIILKIFGWILVITPVMVGLIISTLLIYNAGKDDGDVRVLTMLFLTSFGIGGVILILMYLTDIVGK